MFVDPEQKIGRPRQLFIGSPKRDVQPIHKRKSHLPHPKKRASARFFVSKKLSCKRRGLCDLSSHFG
ncbi:hypothetical protein CR105_23900 [Massilia eurypsychrophila]|jgi:hypothetical protein|uniref:Uncharacterized protein n=1 Tax=Massilia eurypsychrophila TaxID=1485217 RepID=A0A2G8T8Z9_9BURK|nr:hypothetical protein [Massilia eurypsychrophila]PIL42535.1 hypothetical protein CR105_23900 [Massilia eurypsychrophila]